MPLEIQGFTINTEAQLYDNNIFLPGELSILGANLITATAIPIKFKLWDNRGQGGTISNVRLTRQELSDINCYQEGDYWITETSASHAHVLSGAVEFDFERTILGDIFVQAFSIPITDLKREINFLSYSLVIEQDGANLDFSSVTFSMGEVNDLLYQLDQISTAAYSARVIDLTGSSLPNSITGEVNGVAAMTSLVSKGITINI